MVSKKIEWITTAPNPRTRATGFDAGQRGWKLHAVEVIEDSFERSRYQAAACGVLPAHGWSLDLFIEDRCKRCLRRLGSIS
jgi:hypothetical protein